MTAHLLLRIDTDWMQIPDLLCLHAEVRRLLPPELKSAWHMLAITPQGREAERETEPAAIWLAHHGASPMSSREEGPHAPTTSARDS